MRKILFGLIFCITITAAAEQKTVLCAACHGENGISSNSEWPNLAGQHKSYLIKQLNAFKEGSERNAAMMAGIVAGLTKQDIEELADYYSKQPAAKHKAPTSNLSRGEQLYRFGDFKQHITACIACHGPQGSGNEQAGFPALSGQNTSYTVQQLRAFKNHQRSTDLNAIMRDISRRMSEEDMFAVAEYIHQLN